MEVEWWAWGAFGLFVIAMFALDLVAFGRQGEVVTFRRSVGWSIGWTVLGFGFAGFIWLWQGHELAGEFLAGFVIEKSLSIDNLFVFALIFAYFAVPPVQQRRVLFWGIVGAIMLRALFILAGAALLDAFHYTIYFFGGFLVITGLRMARHSNVEIHPERNLVLRLFKGVMTPRRDGERLLLREDGRLRATALLAALVLVATFDVVFAVDSIPAVFAITRVTFIVLAANAFSLLGLAALYFVLVGMLGRFSYLSYGLAAVLVFVGIKMVLADLVEIPVYLSLAGVSAILGASVACSLLWPQAGPAADDETGEIVALPPARQLRATSEGRF